MAVPGGWELDFVLLTRPELCNLSWMSEAAWQLLLAAHECPPHPSGEGTTEHGQAVLRHQWCPSIHDSQINGWRKRCRFLILGAQKHQDFCSTSSSPEASHVPAHAVMFQGLLPCFLTKPAWRRGIGGVWSLDGRILQRWAVGRDTVPSGHRAGHQALIHSLLPTAPSKPADP